MCCRFAQFFISPLISADGVEREVKAVDSEVGRGGGSIQAGWVTHQHSNAQHWIDGSASRSLTDMKLSCGLNCEGCALFDH
jgi:hypothetical protein